MAAVDCDVLVCGLGPVGQLLALLLGRRGVSVIAIDEASEPFDLPRAAVVDDEVLRIFQSAGVLEQILADSQPQSEVSFVTDRGRPLTLLRPDGSANGHEGLVSIHQPSIERTLVAAAREQKVVELRWGHRLDRFHDDGSTVEATVQSVAGDTETIRARWLVGCDGGSSWVRRLLGIEFGGSTFRQRWLVVDVRVDRPLAKVGHPHFFGDWRRPIVCLPMSPGRHRWEWMLHPGEDAEPFLDPEAIDERIRPWLRDEKATVERAVVYTFHWRVASRWRESRVLLAGDAAHLMPPFAGQGFSSGARDAANLAWKLQAVLDGAPESLLDSYEAERRPHAHAMGRLAVALGRFVQTTNRRVAVGRDLFLGALAATGIADWAQQRMKPLPAYGAGAFAERPARLVFKRGVGSQFPQPRVLKTSSGDEVLFDELAGSDWTAVAVSEDIAGPFEAEGIRTLVLGADFQDRSGAVTTWLERHAASWALLRPDRFVFALGDAESAAAERALAELRRQLGRALRAPEARLAA
jgi:3-(3-hydroxy-phenyl)propionate hydroxylase